MDGHEKEICALFGVYRFVSKHDCDGMLRDSLKEVFPRATNAAAR